MGALLCVICVLYFFLNAATRGYYEWSLRVMMILVAGAVLLTPGFLTDIAGFLLLTPPVRRWIRGRLAGYLRGRVSVVSPDSPRGPQEPGDVVIDAEYRVRDEEDGG